MKKKKERFVFEMFEMFSRIKKGEKKYKKLLIFRLCKFPPKIYEYF